MTHYVKFSLNITFVLQGYINFSIISVLHAQPIIYHYYMHYILTEWTVYIIFTFALTPFYTVTLPFGLQARTRWAT